MKIAVIDDDEGIRDLIGEVLTDEGHHILKASDGLEGLNVVINQRPDLIICDINMPKMSGDELFDALRKDHPDFDLIPFIFLSGNASESEQIERLNKGADHCFEKPFAMKLLVAHINSHHLRIRDISDFIKRNLDRIASTLPAIIEHEFSSYEILKNNTDVYVEVIIAAMEKHSKTNKSSMFSSTPRKNVESSQIHNYVKSCLEEYSARRLLIKTANGENLSWALIFMVIDAELEQKKLFVSDLYVSIPAAKSTINTRINNLIADDILSKQSDETDGRRRAISLTKRFKNDFLEHLKDCMEKMSRITG